MRYRSRRRAGVSSVVGAVFFILIMLISIGSLVTIFNSFTSYNDNVKGQNTSAQQTQETSLAYSGTQFGTPSAVPKTVSTPPLAFDGAKGVANTAGTATNSLAATLSTSNPNDVIVVNPSISTNGVTPLLDGSGGAPTTSGGTQSSLAVSLTTSNAHDVIIVNPEISSTVTTPAIDGSAGATTTTPGTATTLHVSLTTTNANDVIIVTASAGSTTQTASVADTGSHAWTQRAVVTSTTERQYEWYTIAASTLSADTTTVTWSAAVYSSMTAFGISGANTASPFDPNLSSPITNTGTGTSPTVSVTTTNAEDFIFGLLGDSYTAPNPCGTPSETLGSGYTGIASVEIANGGGAQSCDVSYGEYKVVSTTQSALAIPFTTTGGGTGTWAWSMIGDAVVGKSNYVTSVSDTAALSWTHRATASQNGVEEEEWYAIAATALTSDSITVDWATAGYGSVLAFGISGAYTTSPFDPNAAVPGSATGTGTSPAGSASTTDSTDFIFGLLGDLYTPGSACPPPTQTVGSGFTQVNSLETGEEGSPFNCVQGFAEYQTVTSTQSALSVPVTTGNGGSGTLKWDMISDAVTSQGFTIQVNSVSDTAGLTWTHRASASQTGIEEEEWYAIVATALTSDSITVTWSVNGFGGFTAFGISGANTASPFDPNLSSPVTNTGTGTSPSATVTTTGSPDFIFGLLGDLYTPGNACPPPTQAAGSVYIQANAVETGQYGSTASCMQSFAEGESVATTESGFSVPVTTGANGGTGTFKWAMIADAVTAQIAAPTLDGSVGAATTNGGTQSSLAASLTTTNANDVIIVEATAGSNTATATVADAGTHTWTQRAHVTAGTTGEAYEWYAIAGSALSSDSITISWSAPIWGAMTAFGVDGANTASPFDPNLSSPVTATGTGAGTDSVSVTTTNSNDLIFGLLDDSYTAPNACGPPTATVGSGYTAISSLETGEEGAPQSCDQSYGEYKVVTSTQSALSVPFTTGLGGATGTLAWSVIGDAVEGVASTSVTTSDATALSGQQKLFYSSGLWWSFYSTGTNIECQTSTDGLTWTTPTAFIAGSASLGGAHGYDFDTALSGTAFYYAIAPNDVSGDKYFNWRYGALSSSGCSSVTWSVSQTQITTTNIAQGPVSIEVDSGGNTWVALTTSTATSGGTYHIEVWYHASSASAGTWTKDDDITGSTTETEGAIQSYTCGVSAGCSVMVYGTEGTGAVPGATDIISDSCTPGCSTWTSAVATTSNYALSQSSYVVIGSTLYFAGVAFSSGTCTANGVLKSWSFVLGSSSAPAETTVESTTGCWQGAMSDSTSTLVLFEAASSTVEYRVSATLGSTWYPAVGSAAIPISTSQTSPSGVSAASSGAFAVEWTYGSGSSFGVAFTSLTKLSVVNDSPFAVHLVGAYIVVPDTGVLSVHYDYFTSGTGVPANGDFDYWIPSGSQLDIPLTFGTFEWSTTTTYVVTFATDAGLLNSATITSPS